MAIRFNPFTGDLINIPSGTGGGGGGDVDLTGYATQTFVNTAITTATDNVATILGNYATTDSVSTILSDYTTSDTVDQKLAELSNSLPSFDNHEKQILTLQTIADALGVGYPGMTDFINQHPTLVSYWPLNSETTSNGVYTDVIGGYNLENTNGFDAHSETIDDTRFGGYLSATDGAGYLEFDGEYPSFGSPAVINESEITFSAWFKTDTTLQAGTEYSILKTSGWDILYVNGNLCMKAVASTLLYFVPTPAIDDGDWHNIVISWNGTNSGAAILKVWVDGEYAGVYNRFSQNIISTGGVTLFNGPIVGNICHVRVFNEEIPEQLVELLSMEFGVPSKLDFDVSSPVSFSAGGEFLANGSGLTVDAGTGEVTVSAGVSGLPISLSGDLAVTGNITSPTITDLASKTYVTDAINGISVAELTGSAIELSVAELLLNDEIVEAYRPTGITSSINSEPSLVAHWPLTIDTKTDTEYVDIISGFNLTIIGDTIQPVLANDFDGYIDWGTEGNDYLETTTFADLGAVNGESYSVSMWINTPSDYVYKSNMWLFNQNGTAGAFIENDDFLHRYIGGSVGPGPQGLVNLSESIANGQWRHLVYVYDSVALTTTLYLDGVLVGTVPTPLFDMDGGPILIGQNERKSGASNAYRFGGKMAQYRIFNDAISPSLVNDLFSEFTVQTIEAAGVTIRTNKEARFAGGGRFVKDNSGLIVDSVSGDITLSSTNPILIDATVNITGDQKVSGNLLSDNDTVMMNGTTGTIPWSVISDVAIAESDLSLVDFAGVVATQIQTNGLPVDTYTTGDFEVRGNMTVTGNTAGIQATDINITNNTVENSFRMELGHVMTRGFLSVRTFNTTGTELDVQVNYDPADDVGVCASTSQVMVDDAQHAVNVFDGVQLLSPGNTDWYSVVSTGFSKVGDHITVVFTDISNRKMYQIVMSCVDLSGTGVSLDGIVLCAIIELK